jgi:Tfp pilus assembly protein PilE
MRRTILGILVAGGIAGILAMSAAPSFAKTVKECDDEYAANKAAIKASGQTKKDYVAACRGETATAPAAAPAAAPAPAPAAPAAPAAANAKPTKDCDAEYAANKAAIKAGGQTKRDFVAACRSGTEVIPTGSAAAPAAPAPAPAAPAAAPAPAPQVAPAPAPVAPKPQVGATGAGGFSTDAQARARCPSDTVVWVNTKSRIYHFAGTHNYGHTEQGTYMCEADAKAAGDRAAENEKHP